MARNMGFPKKSSRLRGAPEDGYDALFELPDGKTIAEAGAGNVNAYNHRRRAMEAACGEIARWSGKKGAVTRLVEKP